MNKTEPIAVIGMSFKFPGGAETTDEFWKILVERRCTATEYPRDRFNIDAFWHPDGKKQNTIKSREGHFLSSDIKNFDAGFFSMPPHEVGSMDPQHRGIMETTYHAFEKAGLRMEDVAGSKTSVHIGCFTSDFATMQTWDTQSIPKYNALGTASSMLASRISWFYDLHGESMCVDTACSSGLVALALGCQGLVSGESDMAVVGSSNIILTPEFSISLSNMGLLSSTGRSHSFDAKGDGYGRGEGFAILILKPLSKAIVDGNPVRGLVRSVGLNQNGHTSGGITQPSKDMQVRLIRDTYRKAGLDMRNTRFFEAHGTGTAVGDPTEARAIGEAFFNYRSKDDPIYVGAVKSNIGHLEGASGLAGMVKALLVLERAVIPPNTNFEKLNPQIDAELLNLRFPTECVPWPKADEIRRASVNSFGFGGSNAHVVLEAADGYLKNLGHKMPQFLPFSALQKKTHVHDSTIINGVHPTSGVHVACNVHITNGAQPTNGVHKANNHREIRNDCVEDLSSGSPKKASHPRLLILSASDEDGIARQAKNLSESLHTACPLGEDGDKEILDDIVFTLNSRRTMLEWKSYGILESLSSFSNFQDSLSSPVRKIGAATPNLGLVFTGQGAQWARMGYELLDWPVFKASMMHSQKYLDTMGCKWCLIEELAVDVQDSRVNIPEFSQVMTTAVQIALVDLINFFAIKPSVVVGHSSGEIAAAYCAGFLCHESAMRVSYFRGVLATELAQNSKSRWGVASVGLSAKEVLLEAEELQDQDPDAFARDQITISCMNSPANTTISGPVASLDLVIAHLDFKNIFARKLKVDVGYHSPQMNSLSSEYSKHLTNLRPGAEVNNIKMVSSVLPGLVGAETVCCGDYWIRNMVSPVRFVEAMDICCTNLNTADVTKLVDRSHSQQIFTDGWLEIGPHAALKGPLREIFSSKNRKDLLYASLLVRNRSANRTVLEAVGRLFCQGFEVDLDRAARIGEAEPREARTIVDLPQYPFNHSVIHWEESARTNASRLRVHEQHPLLGAQVVDWNPLDASWHFIIRKDDIPWVSDHRIHGSMWYPAAGMIVMAVEAVKKLLSDAQFDFELRDVTFIAPIVVSETSEGTETQISVVPARNMRGDRETDYKFRIFVRRMNDTWNEVCDGIIIPQKAQEAALDVNKHDEGEHKRQQAQIAYEKAQISCQGFIKASEMYHKAHKNSGLQYGPSFQCLTDIHYDRRGQAHAQLKALDEGTAISSRPFTIHPATLDSIFQLAIPALSEGFTSSLPTLVPSRLTRLWICREGAGSASTDSGSDPEVAHVQGRFSSKRSAVASTTVFSKNDMRIKVQVEELELTEVARDQDSTASEKAVRSICHELHWAVDPMLLDKGEMFNYCLQRRSNTPEPQEWYIDVRLMLLGFANQTMESMRSTKQKPIPSMEKYAMWLQARLDEFWCSSRTISDQTQGHQGSLPSGAELQKLAEHFESIDRRGAINVLVARQLQEILIGEVDPLQTLFADPEYLADFYEEHNAVGKAFPMLYAYLDVWVHEDPSLRFLEIGAGTGATTNMILDIIANSNQGPRYSEYMFTDISRYFFPRAQEKFAAYDRVQYHTMDIGQHPEAQGFELNRYDVVVAANVLHATKDLSTTLSNARRLLKPHGKLILIELTTPNNIETGFIWGSLPGWWLGSEDYRQLGAVIEEDRWDHLLKQRGFTGTEQVFRDWDLDVCHGWSIMVSSIAPDENVRDSKQQADIGEDVSPNITFIVDDEKSETQIQTAKNLQYMLKCPDDSTGPKIVTFDQISSRVHDLRTRHCVLLADLDRAHLQETNPIVFGLYQKILTGSKSVLWVQTHDERPDCAPYYAMVEGLCRVCRNENPFIKIVNLTLESVSVSSTERMASQIVKVMKATDPNPNPDLRAHQLAAEDQEYMEVSGYLCVGRLRQSKYLDEHIFTRTENPVQLRSFGSVPPVTLSIQVPGLLDTIEWVEDKAAYAPLPADHVEVEVRAIGVNSKDCLTLLGRVNADTLGCECAGYVKRVGSDVRGFKHCDRVAVGCLDTYKTLVRVKERYLVKIPDSMSFEDAAGVPAAFCTAYFCLYNVARLKKGESILIHAAAGGTGQAAVQIAQHIGAEIFATVGSASKRSLLSERYGIREDHIFFSRDASFADGVKRMTDGRGVDVILNSLSGKLLVASWEIIAEFGRFIEIGRKDIDTRGFLPMFPFIRNASFTVVDLMGILDGAGQSNMYILQEVFDLIASGVLRPLYPVQPYPIDRAEQAFRLLIGGKSTGKIVLMPRQDAMIRYKESVDSDYRFSKDATYVIAGGLGGIGRQITRWMARRGAANIILLSRSGPNDNLERLRMIEDLEAQGVTLRYGVCDITNLGSVQGAVQDAARSMPPIKGCVQAAIVIQDRPFANMTHAEWSEAVDPKVHGSWNLHMALPSGLDFFVMLSSAVCIFGNPAQANYSAGNSFQDALARYRVAQGEKAVAIDLGIVLDEGWLAERAHINQRVMQSDLVLPIAQPELFAMFDYYCNPTTTFSSLTASQIVTGIELPALILRAGRQIPEEMTRPMFRAMHQVIPGSETSQTAGAKVQDFAAMFEEAETLAIAGAAVAEALKLKLCQILGLEAEEKTIHDQMDSFGADSLIALEIRNWLAKEIRADLAVYEILGDVKLIDTGLTAARKSMFRQAKWDHVSRS